MKCVRVCAALGVILAISGTAWGGVSLDRWSSSITLDGGTIDVSGANVTTGADWVAQGPFQISLYADEGAGAGNDWWDFNHYQPFASTHKYYAPDYNFPDYDYYHLVIDSVSKVAESLYTGGSTGETADWALYYTTDSVKIQTVLSGSVEGFVDHGKGNITGYLRVEPYASYHAFDYIEGTNPVNAVEIWNDGFLPTDVVGYHLATGSSITLTPEHVPEPASLMVWSLLGGLAVAVGWWRRRKAA